MVNIFLKNNGSNTSRKLKISLDVSQTKHLIDNRVHSMTRYFSASNIFKLLDDNECFNSFSPSIVSISKR